MVGLTSGCHGRKVYTEKRRGKALPKKIVIADDSQFFLISLGLLLKRLGFRVIPAENGEAALQTAKMSEPHLILLDVNIKPTDGISVLKRLKADKQTSHIPVIFLSSVSDGEVIRTCRRMGCSDYILKPLKIRELYDAIQNCFCFRNGINRKHLRVAFNKKVSLTHEAKHYELFSENLSMGGIYLRKNVPLRVGSKADMVLPLDDTRMHLWGTVIYTRELFTGAFELPPGMAIEFKGLTPAERQTLSDYIEKSLARDIAEEPETSREAVERVYTKVRGPA
jgi:CheY-like chemotaxis protein